MGQKNYHENLVNLLNGRASLKQEVYHIMKDKFKTFRDVVEQEINQLRKEITDERVRCSVLESNDFDIRVALGSDVIIFHMHTNVFRFEDQHPIWKTSFLEDNRDLGYFGIINIYNFLYDSFEYKRNDDIGYLIGRVFMNKAENFMVQGLGDISLIYNNFFMNTLNDSEMTEIVQRACNFAVDFDSFAPNYQSVAAIKVNAMQQVLHNLQIETGKRIGFKLD